MITISNIFMKNTTYPLKNSYRLYFILSLLLITSCATFTDNEQVSRQTATISRIDSVYKGNKYYPLIYYKVDGLNYKLMEYITKFEIVPYRVGNKFSILIKK
jgi:hypothetical protein